MIFKLNERNIIVIALAVWFTVSGLYLLNTPQGHRNHDFGGHLEYTEIIHNKHHLPLPYEGWQTYQPPLYYLIINYLAPSIQDDKVKHVDFVRWLSVIYGALTICFIWWVLKEMDIKPFAKLISLLFISTIPKFVMVFSTYNNDSLVICLSVAMFVLSYKLYKNWSKPIAYTLLIVTVGALYAKYSAILSLGVLIAILLVDLVQLKIPSPNKTRIVLILAIAALTFIPWIVFHNHHHTNKIFPTNAEHGLGGFLAVNDDRSVWKGILRIPFLEQDPHEWDDPWAHGYSKPETKKHDYWAFSFLTSIYGEVVYNTPGIYFFWSLICIHLLSIVIALKFMLKTPITKLAGAVIILGHLSQIALILYSESPAACTMDYRYICWIWLAWSVLYADVMSAHTRSSQILVKLLSIGFLVQVFVVLTMTGNTS